MAGESKKSLRGEFDVGDPVVKMTGELTFGLATLVAGRSASRVRKTGAVSCPVVSLTLSNKSGEVFKQIRPQRWSIFQSDGMVNGFPYLAIMIVVSVSGLSVACCSIKACKGRELFKSHSDRKFAVKWGIAYLVNFFNRSICGASTHL